VLVTADEASMNKADRYLTGRRRIVAHNSMTIAVAPGKSPLSRARCGYRRPTSWAARTCPLIGREAVAAGAETGVELQPLNDVLTTIGQEVLRTAQ
jgi:hypothetical protein